VSPESKHMRLVADIGCVICLEKMGVHTTAEIHHVAEGSEPRSDFMVAPLCPEHHRGQMGIHGMGVRAFCSFYELSNEFALLGLVNKWLARSSNFKSFGR
jgi:hypothetical protein